MRSVHLQLCAYEIVRDWNGLSLKDDLLQRQFGRILPTPILFRFCSFFWASDAVSCDYEHGRARPVTTKTNTLLNEKSIIGFVL